MTDPAITPDIIAKHGLKPDEYQRIESILKTRAELHGARHLLDDVERALLV